MQIKNILYGAAVLTAQFAGTHAVALPQQISNAPSTGFTDPTTGAPSAPVANPNDPTVGGMVQTVPASSSSPSDPNSAPPANTSSGSDDGQWDPNDPLTRGPDVPINRDPKNIGFDNNVNIANNAGQKIHVLAVINLDWAIVDFVTDAALLLTGAGEIKEAYQAAKLPGTLKTARDLFAYLKFAGQIIKSGELGELAVGGIEAALKFQEAFKGNSVPIEVGEFKNVKDENVLDMYLSADGIASLFGASNISLMVMSGDGKQITQFNTNSDYSWIATKNQQLVRAKYGTIWEEDPSEGTQPWPIVNKSGQ